MSDLIDRGALLDRLKEAYVELKKIYDGLQYVDERRICGAQLSTFAETVLRVKKAPTVDAEPVRHGEWLAVKVDATETKFQCSECGSEVKCGNDYFMKPTKHVNASYPYCHCGARMDGGKNSEEDTDIVPAHGS